MKYVIGALLVACSFNCMANFYCTGTVQYLGSDTNLYLSNGHGIHKMCSLDEAKCSAWLSMAMAAKMTERSVAIYYSGGSAGGKQNDGLCKDIGNWVTPSNAPYHFQIF